MSTRRPLKNISDPLGFKEMSDSELERLSYEIRKAYAIALDDTTTSPARVGHINVGGSGTSIGSAENTRRLSSTDERNSYDHGGGWSTGGNWPMPFGTPIGGSISTQYHSSTVETVATYSYKQDRTANTPITANINDYSYFVYGSTAGQIVLEGTEANIFDTIISDCVAKMATGDEVGTYRVSKSTVTPTNGGAGTWINKGALLTDTLANPYPWTSEYTSPPYGIGGTTTTVHNLWLKTGLTSPPTETKPIGRSGATIKPVSIDYNGDLVQKIMLPSLQSRHDNNQLNYHVQTATGYTNRGNFTNRHIQGSWGSSQSINTNVTPTKYSTDSNVHRPQQLAHVGTINTWYLNLQT